MGIAGDDVGAHAHEVVDEIHSAFEHFFKEEGGALGLCGEDNCNTHQVGGEGGPNAVFDLGGGVADVAFDRSIGLLG